MSGFGLLGEHLTHSFSPKVHSAFGTYEYGLYEVPPQDLAQFMNTAQLEGMNVTIPYKRTVMPFCAELSPAAQLIGSVNTLVRRNGGWYGDNTDAYGLEFLLRHCGYDPEGKKCAVFGSGGASVMAQYVLKRLGASSVRALSRQGRNDYLYLKEYAGAQLLLNATPVGMYPGNGKSPAPVAAFPDCEAVIDLVYNPLRTELLLSAGEQGRKIVRANGLPMLVAQAARSAELFTGQTIGETLIEETLCKLSKEQENIILIGMPGCGKTTVGQALAARTGKQFRDLDRDILEATGKSPEEWIRTRGETEFRKAETGVLSGTAKQTGIVLACGGGTVTVPENERLLRQNGRIIWLRRAPGSLEINGRPLSERRGVEVLLKEREPMYRRFADLCVDNEGTVAETVENILEKIK